MNIKNSTKKLLKSILNKTEKKLLRLEKELRLLELKENGKKILFTHSFSIYEPSFVHDKLMAFALNLRGFEILATYCDGIQEIECNVFGGVWGGGKNFNDNCKLCQSKSRKLWSFLKDENIYKYSKYITDKDFQIVEKKMSGISNNKWIDYCEGCLDIGFWAKDILVNNYVVGDFKLIENYEKLGRAILKNLLLCKIACERIIVDTKPDRILSNDSYYGMWKMWEMIAKENNIPFYSHWSGTRLGGWTYAYDGPSMKLDFSKSWSNYSMVALTSDSKIKINQWLEDRKIGKDMVIDTSSLSSYKDNEFDFSTINKHKPTALLSANIVWDLAALNKEIFTNSMADWIIKTIKWFKKNPDFQLIIKPHPAEALPGIPQTKETVKSMINSKGIEIPNNVIFLSAKSKITVYDIFPLSKVGLVFTSSVGMEMAARGIPVITAGKSHYHGYGFTYDPISENEYFTLLGNILDGTKDINKKRMIDLSSKFIKFNFFHYYTKTGLMEFAIGKKKGNPVQINIDTISQLKKGHNKHFDYIVNCIENGEPILSENKWMDES